MVVKSYFSVNFWYRGTWLFATGCLDFRFDVENPDSGVSTEAATLSKRETILDVKMSRQRALVTPKISFRPWQINQTCCDMILLTLCTVIYRAICIETAESTEKCFVCGLCKQSGNPLNYYPRVPFHLELVYPLEIPLPVIFDRSPSENR